MKEKMETWGYTAMGYGLWDGMDIHGGDSWGDSWGMGIFHMGQDKGMHRVHTHYGMI